MEYSQYSNGGNWMTKLSLLTIILKCPAKLHSKKYVFFILKGKGTNLH